MKIREKSTTLNDICTPAILVKENPEILTDPQVTWLLKTRHKNGLADTGAIIKISQKLYINKPQFFEWFLKQKA